MLTPPRDTLNSEARRRLEAIESFSELGSGMNIAMQDLDIRGAGNLLGAEQSGFIADLGYETYQKVLAEAVRELKVEEFSDILHEEEDSEQGAFVKECLVESDLELFFPPLYVPDGNERILLYRELDSITDEKNLNAFRSRMRDRFGAIPREGEELIRMVTLRHKAQSMGIEKIYLKGGKMTLFFVETENKKFYESDIFGKILSFINNTQFKCRTRDDNHRMVVVVENIKDVETALAFTEEMQHLCSI